MKNSFLILLAAVLLSGCMTQKKQARIAKAYMNENTEELARLCAVHFKPVIEYKPGQVIHKTDTQYIDGDPIPCPPNEKGEVVYVKGRDKVIRDTVWRTDTASVRDVAFEQVLRADLRNVQDSLLLTKQSLTGAKKARNISYWGNAVLLLLSGGLLWLKLR